MKFLFFSLSVLLIAMIWPFRLSAQKTMVVAEHLTNGSFDDYPVYNGKDLGLTYSKKKSVFKIWSPAAFNARMFLYDQGSEGDMLMVKDMKREKNGVWSATIKGDLEGKFYTFQIQTDSIVAEKESKEINEADSAMGRLGSSVETARGNDEGRQVPADSSLVKAVVRDTFWLPETPDPYAVAVGVNGWRAMVVDLKKTNPEGWEQDQRPPLRGFSDIVLYELHLRDISVHPSSGIKNKGKFLGLAETGTKTPGGESTGLDHIRELGVTHVHILPAYDFMSIDETKLEENKYNWGYDPQNYNVPEGSYSTDPYDGRVRIREFKQMVKALHDNGLRVVMDVVYNHTGASEESVFNRIAPMYYYRLNDHGGFSNASGCGNETASERPMVRKFMLESMLYWVKEYHVDGFRVDLMGIHDIETMNLIAAELRKVDPTIFIYGEGWTAGESPFDEQQRAVKTNTWKLNNIAVFSDEFRDGVKGHVFTPNAKGFASGEDNLVESVKFGIVGATNHPQVQFKEVNYSKYPWSNFPTQCINYVSCHDNHTLYDRFQLSCKGEPEAEWINLVKFAYTMLLTSQGIPFLHAGEEFTRTKFLMENSFESPDYYNQIVWEKKEEHKDLNDYVKGLIQLRKNHPAFKMSSAEMIAAHIEFLQFPIENIIGYVIKDNANGDSWKRILLIFNGNKGGKQVEIPEGKWKIICREGRLNLEGMGDYFGNKAMLSPRSALILAEE